MKTSLLSIDGKEKGKIELPKLFDSDVRFDIIAKVIEVKKTWQPYGPSPVAGKQSSSSGKLYHRRGVWKSEYKKGISRVPRKIMTRRGEQFNWVGAFSPNTIGGRRAHPPRPISMINTLMINKKELKLAFLSALAATAKQEIVAKRYKSLDKSHIKTPLVVESKITGLKAKELLKSVKNIVGEEAYKVSVKTKKIRAGIGKSRGRKYKRNAGALIVVGKSEKIKTNAFDVKNTGELSVADLANGGAGRITIYTENAIKDIGEKFK